MKKLLSVIALMLITFYALAQKTTDTLTDEEADKVQCNPIRGFRTIFDLQTTDYGKVNRYVKWLTAVCLYKKQLLPQFLSLNNWTTYIFVTEDEEEYDVKVKNGDILALEYCREEKRWCTYTVDIPYLQSKKYFLELVVP
jgi:hypothetical protein